MKKAKLLLLLAVATVSASAAAEDDAGPLQSTVGSGRYVIVRATDGWWGANSILRAQQMLAPAVNDAIARGYQPVGGVSVVSAPQVGTTVSQALVRLK
ncbi:hypothetical protein [Burkholderia territorii]|uniref:hypothetical protein n=1 Tax=Burkholderia territorii TaxID=1503055 RepID=UPI0012D9DFA4|nr:hypothetical protein [Burkholderia territorii]